MTITEIVNKKSCISLIEPDIIYVHYSDNSVLDTSDLKESFHAYLEISQGQPLKVLSVFGSYTTVTADARKYAENINIQAMAEAIVFMSLAQRLLLRFFQKFRKPTHPIKFFKNTEEAIKWLNSVS